MNNYCVITTVNPPTKAIEILHEKFGKNLIVVGDKKTPENWEYKDVTYINPTTSLTNHYARKNIGYLEAMKNGATLIYCTDDDNVPNDKWKVRELNVSAKESVNGGWYNVYSLLSPNFMWPRGFSLNRVRSHPILGFDVNVESSIQQGLSDGEPDVDAIFRLIFQRRNMFDYKKSIYLRSFTWCPFNSQSTWFFPKAFPLMYLPITASFRMTDIYRSFVAQRCLWELGEGVTFHSPSEVFQDRNEHDLMKDFADEVHGYLNVDKIVELLGALILKKGEEYVCENLYTCYEELTANSILPVTELFSVKKWIKDYGDIKAAM